VDKVIDTIEGRLILVKPFFKNTLKELAAMKMKPNHIVKVTVDEAVVI
jgi:hypothetical protein